MKKKKKNFYVILGTIISVYLCIELIFSTVFYLSYVVGRSMEPTIENGDFIFGFRNKNVHKNEIISFYHSDMILVKRVIGMPNDHIKINRCKDVYVNNVLFIDKYTPKPSCDGIMQHVISKSYYLKKDEYFVMGDHRGISADSRYFGLVNKAEIKGRVLMVLR